MKFTKTLAVILSLVIAVTAMFTSVFAVEEDDASISKEQTTDETTDVPNLEDLEGSYIKATLNSETGTVVISTFKLSDDILAFQYTLEFTGAKYAGMEICKLPGLWEQTYADDDIIESQSKFTGVVDGDFVTNLGDVDIAVVNFTDIDDLKIAISNAKGCNSSFQGVPFGSILDIDGEIFIEEPKYDEPTIDEPIIDDSIFNDSDLEAPEGPYIKATVDAEAGTVTLSTVNFPEEIYGLQYTLDFTGATYAGMEKGKLPAGWSETYPKDADIATGFTAALDCDFSTVLADQDILVINFTDAADIEVAISGAKAVNGAFQGVEVASYVECVVAEDTETEVPVEPETETETEEPTTEEPVVTPDTNTDVKGDEPSTGDVDTGVVGFASILGVVALAGAVASKKR